MTALLEWRNYRYFPYERDFARWEVEHLFQAKPEANKAGLTIPSTAFREESAERLTYFARAVHPNGQVTVPQQVKLEASAEVSERERQATRYSAHGLHEYKGKFNPQVVRAIGNVLGLREGEWVLDPFCGSGTTLLECAHAGWNAAGIDRNPLAVRIANAKLQALHQSDGTLEETAVAIVADLEQPAAILSSSAPVKTSVVERQLGSNWSAELPCLDYLRSWYTLPVLAQVVAILRSIRAHTSDKESAVFEVILSDHLRDVSLQDPGDLRIRRRKEAQANYPLIEAFVGAVIERLARVARARTALGEIRGVHTAILDDVREFARSRSSGLGEPFTGYDAVITSPPYETALPYIDTQRLSLVLLGEIAASDIQSTEKALIGAREIGIRERGELENAIECREGDLPSAVFELCRELLSASKGPGNGFRRKNRPALAYRYFMNMSLFFKNMVDLLRPGAKLALVVGPNRTILGGREFEIDTPRLLVAVAVHTGYSWVGERTMDTYPRYDLHQRNSIQGERLLLLTAP